MGEWHGRGGHIRAASHVNPTADLVNSALSNQARSILSKCAPNPAEVNFRRENAIGVLVSVDKSLAAQRELRPKRLPERPPADGIDFPMIFILTVALKYDDINFVRDLSQGMPIAGPITATPGLAARKKAAETTYKEWKEGIHAGNLKIHDRVLKSQAIDIAQI